MSDETISLADLLLQCEQAERRMSVTNPHRLLMAQCRVALLDLAERLRPVFPPNREIVEGEPICAVCGCGKRSHGAAFAHEFAAHA